MTSARQIAKSLDPKFRTNADGGFVARCPAHDDDKPSLKISDGDNGKPVVFCHAGCTQESVIDALKGRGLWPEPPKREPKAVVVKSYEYHDHKTGELVMVVDRLEPKSFRQRRPDPERPGQWTWSVSAEHRTLYNAVAASQYDKAIFIVEGEKDVDNLAAIGCVGVCNPGGAAKWQDSYNEILQGKDVIILPDNDESGEKHLRTVGMALQGVAKRVRVLRLPDLPPKGDFTDWYVAGGTLEALIELVKNQAVDFEPVAEPAKLYKGHANDNNIRVELEIGSDVELAEILLVHLSAIHGNIIHAEGSFWRYNTTNWEPLPENEMRRATHRFDGCKYGEGRDLKTIRLTANKINSILRECETICSVPDFFAAAPRGINCASGFIEFSPAGEPHLVAHNRDHRCRHTLSGHWQPGDYTGLPKDSLLHRLLHGSFLGDEDEQGKCELIAEICGVAALGYATDLREPKAVVFYGMTAENGKSQVLDLVRGLLPASAVCSIPAAKIGDERHIVGLAGKLLNATDELSSDAIASDKFKAVVTGEPVEGRDVYKSRLEFRPLAQHMFATNVLPPYKGGMDRGVQRRLIVIPFNRTVPKDERVEHIGQKIAETEADLLLAWAVEGASRVVRNRGYTIPGECHIALRGWAHSADAVLGWIAACVEPSEGGWIATGEAYRLFCNWAVEEGYNLNRLPQKNVFVQRVLANVHGAWSNRSGKERKIMGISIKY